MMKVFRAAHCVQLIRPEGLGQPTPQRFVKRPRNDDSSGESESSGDESLDEAPPPKKRRRDLNLMEKVAKERAWRAKDITYRIDKAKRQFRPRKDYLLLEFAENGDLETLIKKVTALTGGEAVMFPNRALWALWLCLVRACVAMKYPPRKFHPNRPRPPRRPPLGAIDEEVVRSNSVLMASKAAVAKMFNFKNYETQLQEYLNVKADLIEEIPPPEKRWRAKNQVHFDIDASNVFIGSLEKMVGPEDDEVEGDAAKDPKGKQKEVPASQKRRYDQRQPDRQEGEHDLIPRLKLADFGLAENIKKNKRNIYYFQRRGVGKMGFFAPEQFGPEWDAIPPIADGDEVSESQVAGNYSSATNVWGIALTMWTIITQLEPPLPPQPQVPPQMIINENNLPKGSFSIDEEVKAIDPDAPISYCPLLMDGDNEYEYIDPELRWVIYQCMYHRPNDRPTVEELLEHAKEGITRSYEGETDEAVKSWFHQVLYSGPTEVKRKGEFSCIAYSHVYDLLS
ncbi:kinase-like domain-containing protein [Xylariaceae sp. FL0662B]|nr:kinase-like domain-containing protein [Xylariaceae sp. FL0662B]